jgi:hypothetical protein
MDQEIVVAPGLWELANLAAVIVSELPVEDVKVLSHPALVKALDDHAVTLLVNPPNAHLHLRSLI